MVAQPAVPLSVEHVHQGGVAPGVPTLQFTADPMLDRADHLIRIHLLHDSRDPLLHHLGVARHPQNRGIPFQLVAHPVGLLTVEEAAERPQGAAHASGRHPRLVDAVAAVGPDIGLAPDDHRHLLGQVVHDHLCSRSLGRHMLSPYHPFRAISQGAGQFRRRPGGIDPLRGEGVTQLHHPIVPAGGPWTAECR